MYGSLQPSKHESLIRKVIVGSSVISLSSLIRDSPNSIAGKAIPDSNANVFSRAFKTQWDVC